MENGFEIIKTALKWFVGQSLYSSKISKDNGYTIVSNVLKRNGGIDGMAKLLFSRLPKNDIISNTGLENKIRIACAKYYVSSYFQKIRLSNNVEDADFSDIYEKSFMETLSSFNGKVKDDKGSVINLVSLTNNNEQENYQQNLSEFVITTTAIATFALEMVVGYCIGKANTEIIKSSPKATAFISNTAEKYPTVSKITDFLTWTDIEEIQNKNKEYIEGESEELIPQVSWQDIPTVIDNSKEFELNTSIF